MFTVEGIRHNYRLFKLTPADSCSVHEDTLDGVRDSVHSWHAVADQRSGENIRAHKCEFKRRNKNTLKLRVNELEHVLPP